MRGGAPASRGPLLERLETWASKGGRQSGKHSLERAALIFGSGDSPWDEERVLERYEMHYEAGLVPEAFVDRAIEPPPEIATISGLPMVADHRRILATALKIGRASCRERVCQYE